MIKEITKENFEEEVLKFDKKVLVDFNADWCGPCRMLRPILEELVNDDYKIVSVNIDSEEDLAEKYSVSSIPCLVLFENGNEINRMIGLQSKDTIEEMLGDK